METEDFSAYRDLCTNRIQRLERYKKARSFCNLEDSQVSEASTSEKRLSEVPSSDVTFFSDSDDSSKSVDKENPYEVIRSKFMDLMDNDMMILKQLLELGDKVSEIRKRNLRRSYSTSSMGQFNEDDELEDQFDEPPFSASMSAVTTLVVDDSQPQYFSRQNSVLRIPIQPRRSNRFGSKRVPRRPSEAMRPPMNRNLRVTTDESSSESSDGPLSPLSHTPSSVSSKSSVTYSSSSASEAGKKSRSSNSSIDSGIRESADDSTSPSPTFEREVA